MADKCSVCRSTDVLAGTDFRTCLACGRSTAVSDGSVVAVGETGATTSKTVGAKKKG